jgi:hypothetical protein
MKSRSVGTDYSDFIRPKVTNRRRSEAKQDISFHHLSTVILFFLYHISSEISIQLQKMVFFRCHFGIEIGKTALKRSLVPGVKPGASHLVLREMVFFSYLF